MSGGLATRGLAYADQVAAEAIQVFVSNPRGWSRSPGVAAEDARLRERADLPVFVHAPYLVNLASPDDGVVTKSCAAVRHALVRGGEIGARGVVVHTGSAVGASRDDGLKRVRRNLLPLLEELADGAPRLLLEPMAARGRTLCATVADLGAYLDALDWHPRAGVCLDTAHLFAAGHDISTPEGMAATLDEVDAVAGRDRLGLVHANDAATTLDSGRDRHANLGAGGIGAEPFAALFRHPVSAGVPVVVETPGPAEPHAADVARLKELRAHPTVSASSTVSAADERNPTERGTTAPPSPISGASPARDTVEPCHDPTAGPWRSRGNDLQQPYGEPSRHGRR